MASLDLGSLKFSINADAGQANKELDDTSGKMSKFSDKSAAALKGFGKAIAAVTVAIVGMAIKFGKDAVEAYMAAELAQNRLQTIMTNVTGATQEQIDSVRELASALQAKTVIEDDAAASGASQLASYGLNTNAIKTLMPALGDLAVAQYGVNVSGEQMISTANLIGKAVEGNVGALTRAGIVVSDEYKAALDSAATSEEKAAIMTKILQENYGGLAESAANTAQGALVQLKNSFGDVQEELGAKLIPVVTKFVDLMNQHMPEIKNVLSSVFEAVIPVIDKMLEKLLPIIEEWLPKLAEMVGKLLTAISPLLDTLGEIFDGVMPIVMEVLDILISELLPPLVDLFGMVFDVIKPLLPIIKDLISSALRPIMNVVGQLVTALKPLFDALGIIIGAFSSLFPSAQEGKQGLNILGASFAAFGTVVTASVGLVGTLIFSLVEGIKWLVNAVQYLFATTDAERAKFEANMVNSGEAMGAAWQGYAASVTNSAMQTYDTLMGVETATEGTDEAIIASSDSKTAAVTTNEQIITDTQATEQAERQAAAEEYSKQVEDLTNQHVTEMGSIYDKGIEVQKAGMDKTKANMQEQIEDFSGWRSNIQKLAQRVPPEVAAELGKLGPEAAPLIQDLANASDSELSEWVNIFQQRSQLAKDTAIEQIAPLSDGVGTELGEVDKVLKDTKAVESTSKLLGQAVVVSVQTGLTTNKESLVTTSKAIGAAVAGGVATGIKNHQYEAVNAAVAMVRAAIAAARRAGDINSPSKKMADLVGQPLADGVGVGFENGLKKVAGRIKSNFTQQFKTLSGSVNDIAPAISARSVDRILSGNTSAITNNNSNKTQNNTFNFTARELSPYEQLIQTRRLSKEIAGALI